MTQTISQSPRTQERFDANQIELAGVVTRIWQRGQDIFARLAARPGADAEEAAAEFDLQANQRATLYLPGGLLNGQEASLCKGDRLRLGGCLVDLPQIETLPDFLQRAGKPELLSEIPALRALEIRLRRAMTCVLPETLQVVSALPELNAVRLEGIAARVWEYDGHRFVRLAVYDRHTCLTGENGKHGRARRIPHYITVQFTDGAVGGRAVSLKVKDRCRVSGILIDRPYSESMRSFLLDAHQAEILAELPNSDDIGDLRIRRSSACVVAQTLIQFTR
jgi:hypothetical protein